MSKSSSNPTNSRYRNFDRIALILVLALVIARCLTSEYVRDPTEVMPGSPPAPRGVGAAVGVTLDLLCCTPALLVLLRQSLTRTRRRSGKSSCLFIAFAIIAAVSFCWASDRYAAAVGAAHLLAAAALLWTAAQLIHDWQSGTAIAVTCLGLLLAYLAYGIYYESVDLPDLRDRWTHDIDHTRTQVLQQHGWAEGSFAAKQFELQILHGNLAGFSTSSNTYAAMLVLLSIVVAGLLLSEFRDRKNLLLILFLIPLLWLLYLTGCKAAFGTIFLATLAFLILRLAGPIVSRSRRAIYFLIVATFLILIAVTVQYGLRHGNLHNDSLNFRWRYWVAAARIFHAHPIHGIGWNSFGEYYLSVRLPAASEEIKDPHDMFVRVFTELGLIGGIIFTAFIVLAWWRMTRDAKPGQTSDGIITARGLIIAIVLAFIINAWASIDFSQIPAFVFLELMRRFLYLAMLLIAVIFGLNRDRKKLISAPLPWLLPAIAIGLGLFLIHNLIDFAIFDPSPGPLMLFVLLTGTLIGMRSPAIAKARLAWTKFAIVLIIFLAATIAFIIPVISADSDTQAADDLLRSGKIPQAIPLYAQAAQTLPFNPDYWQREATALAFAGAPRIQIDAALNSALSADSRYIPAYLLRARYLEHLPQVDQPAIITAYQGALRLDPNQVSTRLEFADFLKSISHPKDAADQYEKALWFNDQFPLEEPKRLPPYQVHQIRQTIAQLRNSAR